MKLENSAIYQQPAGGSSQQKSRNGSSGHSLPPYLKFLTWKEFNLDRTDEELFRKPEMKNSVQLRRDIDSLNNGLGKTKAQ